MKHTVGIDVGARAAKIALVADEEVVATVALTLGSEVRKEVGEALDGLLVARGLDRSDLAAVKAVGSGKTSVTLLADSESSEVVADGRGSVVLVPEVGTLLDVGAEEARALLVEPGSGRILDFCMNEKCAAGSGVFAETMSRTLELTLEEFAQLSLLATEQVPINAQCTIFAESEVVSLIHQNVAKADIVRAVHDAMADRVAAMARRIGLQQPVVLIGGVSKNVGFVQALEVKLGCGILVAPDAEFAGSIGAAFLAAEELEQTDALAQERSA